MELSKENMEDLLGDSFTTPEAPQSQLLLEEVIKVSLPEVREQSHCLHCQHHTLLWDGLGELKQEEKKYGEER